MKNTYTLYFRVKDNNKETNVPLLSMDLVKMDEFTTNFFNCKDLYESLPNNIKEYIESKDKENIKELDQRLFISNEINNDIAILFNDDIDVLYVTLDELTEEILNNKMSLEEYQKVLLKSKLDSDVKGKYNFFKYLYENFVKNEKVKGMIDLYDTNKKFSNLKEDELFIAAIATDKDNIIVLCKKIGQYLETRRTLAIEFKKVNNKVSYDENKREIKTSLEKINKMIEENFNEFIK